MVGYFKRGRSKKEKQQPRKEPEPLDQITAGRLRQLVRCYQEHCTLHGYLPYHLCKENRALFLRALNQCDASGLDIEPYVARQFRVILELRYQPFPAMLSCASVEYERSQAPDQDILTARHYEAQLELFKTLRYDRDPRQILCDKALAFRPFFMFAMATMHRLEDIAEELREEAAAEVLSNPFLTELMPDAARRIM